MKKPPADTATTPFTKSRIRYWRHECRHVTSHNRGRGKANLGQMLTLLCMS